MIVDSVMTRAVVTCAPDASVQDAARLLRDRRIGCVVVVERDRPLGIVTERDVACRVVAEGLDAARTPVRAVMSRPLVTVEPTAGVESALEAMKARRIKRLVVALDGRMRGIVTLTDLAHARPELTKAFMDSWVKARWED